MKNEKKKNLLQKIELGYCLDYIVRGVCIAILKLYCKNRREGCWIVLQPKGKLYCRIVLQEADWGKFVSQYNGLYCD